MQCCRNPNYPGYPAQGGKGVSIDQEWQDFIPFLRDMGPMPEGCNALVRLDPKIHYCKHNCKWGFARRGRPRSDKEKPITKKTKKNRIKEPKVVCVTLEKDHVEFIKQQALALSRETGQFVETNDLIREALQKAFPAPKQFDMFGNKR